MVKSKEGFSIDAYQVAKQFELLPFAGAGVTISWQPYKTGCVCVVRVSKVYILIL